MKKIKMPRINTERLKTLGANIPKFRHLDKWTFLALMSYLSVLVFIPVLMAKKNDFVKFHSRQGLILFLFTAIGLFSFYIPVLFYIVTLFISICIIFGIWSVFTGKERELPWIGKLA